MKNFLILGLTALLLFSISAALSLWLNQGRYATDTSPSTEKASKKSSAEKDATEPHPQKTESKTANPGWVELIRHSFANLSRQRDSAEPSEDGRDQYHPEGRSRPARRYRYLDPSDGCRVKNRGR